MPAMRAPATIAWAPCGRLGGDRARPRTRRLGRRPPADLALRFADGSTVPLGGRWRYQFVPESMGFPPRAPWESVSGLTSIYNAMIAPLLPYGLRGVLWYQGESNAGEADHYRALLA